MENTNQAKAIKLDLKWQLIAILSFVLAASFAFYFNSLFILAIPFGIAFLWYFITCTEQAYWLFILSIPLSFQIYLAGDSLSTTVPDEQFMWLFTGCLGVWMITKKNFIPKWYWGHPIVLVLMAQMVWLVVSVYFSQNVPLSAKFLAAKTWFWASYIILPIAFVKQKKDFYKMFRLLAIPISVHALFAFILHARVEFNYYDSNNVVHPFYYNHVDYSTVLSMIFMGLLVAFQLVAKDSVWKKVILIAILFYIPAIIAASARAAILAVVFGLIVNLAIRIRLVNLIMPGLFLVVGLMITYLNYNNNFIKLRPDYQSTHTQRTFGETVSAMFTGKDMSSMERFYRWIASVRMSEEHPLVGVGPNNFYDYYKPFTIPMFKTYVSRNEEKSTTHNYFLYMLVEQGWPAMILYGLMMVMLFARAQIIYYRKIPGEYKKIAMGLIMIIAAGFVNNFFSELIETHKVGAIFYLSISLLIILDYHTKRIEKNLPTSF